MRIETLISPRYFFILLKEDPTLLKRYALVFALAPLLIICIAFDWNAVLILMLATSYAAAALGFFAAFSTGMVRPERLKGRLYQKLLGDSNVHPVIIRDNKSRKIVFANQSFYRTLGVDPKADGGLYFEDFIEEESLAYFHSKAKKSFRVKALVDDKTITLKHSKGHKLKMQLLVNQNNNGRRYTVFTFKKVSVDAELNLATRQFALDLLQRQSKFKSMQQLQKVS